jgi:hypothetical protein
MAVMRRATARIVIPFVALLGCSNDEPSADPYECIASGGQGCFEMPDDALYAVDGNGNVVPAVLDCDPYPIISSTSPVDLGGATTDLFGSVPTVDGVRVQAFSDVGLIAQVFDVTSDSSGGWNVSLASMPSLAFTRVTKPGNLDVQSLYVRLDVTQSSQSMNVPTATKTEVADTLASTGDRFAAGHSQLFAIAYDCAGNHLASAIVNVSTTSAKNGTRLFEPGVRAYYSTAADASKYARRTQLHQTSGTSGIVVANIQPGMHFVQLWGFLMPRDLAYGESALKLVAEYPIVTFDGEAALVMPLYTRH